MVTGAFMPGARWMMSGGYYNGKIYLAGGTSGGTFGEVQTQVWMYDPVNNAWDTNHANMPEGRMGAGYGMSGGHLYVIGGANLSGLPTDTVYDYDIEANTWTTQANMPTAVYGPGSAVANGRVLLFGEVRRSTARVNPSVHLWTHLIW